ncbi:translation initiation factor eIF-2B subunit delta-like [Centruroides sculpturatus]|uniref:translation initiation factor eIF-2B subunit delta-like n=1 Tax=Centruroides sculpturatus TaxID=218467 RepID=UPI000C6D9B5E|nr:translation initiation factor eIF-2B subunit delta-like [Centruroides sculpturatus]XP_023210583.1 translation initiation factor eIF-2B subunit delta-like [Centruroides sculpturatus]XP_023210584.1 translation initiation factor eIF-2B subunit delta-like [Centruroides sculpturatus]
MPATDESITIKSNLTTTAIQGEKNRQKTKAQLKAERKAAFEAQHGNLLSEKKAATTKKSKAERRAIQEAQRAAKQTNKQANVKNKDKTEKSQENQVKTENLNENKVNKVVGDDITSNTEKVGEEKTNKLEIETITHSVEKSKTLEFENHQKTDFKKVRLFSHLSLRSWDNTNTKFVGLSGSVIHPAIIKLGLKTISGTISGSNGRAVALLAAFKEVIKDYVTPPQKELSRDLESKIKQYVNFLNQCRPLSVSMVNTVKFLRWQVTHIPNDISDAKAKDQLNKAIDDFIHVEIELAQEAISGYAFEKISDGDVIMTYACSSLVKKVLCDAFKKGKKFRVIVVDSRPKLEGQATLKHLMAHGIPCSYIFINAISYVMKEVTSVMLGAHSLQANGYVMSRIGSSQISLVAHAYNVPVLVCCETYKFCERVHTDAFVHNELGDPNDLTKIISSKNKECLTEWKDIPSLHLLNLLYDVTPPDLVAMVITEKDKLPCTSVPVVLRVKYAGILDS